MSAFIVETLILLAIAFVIGFLLGLIFRRWRRHMEVRARIAARATVGPMLTPVPAGAAHSVAGNGAAGTVEASEANGSEPLGPQGGEDSSEAHTGAAPDGAGAPDAESADEDKVEPSAAVVTAASGAASAPSAGVMLPGEAPPGSVAGGISAEASGVAPGGHTGVGAPPANGAAAGGTGHGASGKAGAGGVPDEGAHPGRRPPLEVAPETGGADNLKLLKGIGPQNEQRLNALGIYHFRQIAAWSEAEAQWVGSYLAFPGRIERENWIGQAKAILSGTKPEDLKLPPRRRG